MSFKIILGSAFSFLALNSCFAQHAIITPHNRALITIRCDKKGAAELAQLRCLDQRKDTNDRAFKNSCGYHAIRNSIAIAKACKDQENSSRYLEMLLNKEQMNQALAVNGAMRNFIRQHRNRNNSSCIDTQEAKDLANHLKAHDPGLVGVPIAVYANDLALPPDHANFNAFFVDEDLREMREKINRNENMTGIILVCNLVNSNEQSIGHWVAIVVNTVGAHHQYFLTDSFGSTRVFSTDRSIGHLLTYLEGNNEPIAVHQEAQLTRAQIQAHPLAQAVRAFQQERLDAQAAHHEKSLSEEKISPIKPIIQGIVAGVAVFITYFLIKKYYVKKNTNSASQALPFAGQTPEAALPMLA